MDDSIELDWPHQTIEFAGYVLGVVTPNPVELRAYALSTDSIVPDAVRTKMAAFFAWTHIGWTRHTEFLPPAGARC